MRKYLMAAAVLCTAASMASASVLIYEPFDYAAGTAIGTMSPDGGTHTWAVTGGGPDEPTAATPSANLAVPSSLPAAVGNSVAFGAKGKTDRINLGGAQNSGVLYYSMALKITDLGTLPTQTAHNQIVAGFNNSTGTQAGNPSAIGAALWVHPDGDTSTTAYNLGVTTTSATTGRAYSTAAYNVGDTVFVIGAYDFGTSLASLWVYSPTDTLPATAPAPTAASTSSTGAYTSLASFLLYQQNAGTANMLGEGGATVDELRVGTTWADVTSVTSTPEPATLSLVGLGAIGLIGRRRRA